MFIYFKHQVIDMYSQASQIDDGYSSSGSEGTIPSPPPTPDRENQPVLGVNEDVAVATGKKKSPKKRKPTTKGTKLVPWRANDKLDEVLFALALIEKPHLKKQGRLFGIF